MSTIERVGVIGGGVMGSGIAEVCARAGRDVVLCELDEGAAHKALNRIERSLARGVKAGKLTDADVATATGHLRLVTSLDAMQDRQLTVEAVTEHEPLKIEIFRRLDEVVEDADAILASNTSILADSISGMASITISRSAMSPMSIV